MLNKIYIIVCEGKSEKAYIQELNRYFRAKSLNIVLHPKEVGTGHYTEVIKKYKSVYKANKNQKIEIWLDYDIYRRNEHDNMTLYNSKPKNIPDFMFNYMNFEDFITLHLDSETLKKWYETCQNNHHFQSPMKSDICKKLLTDPILKDYEKGKIPFTISEVILDRLFENSKLHDDLKSEFTVFLQTIINI